MTVAHTSLVARPLLYAALLVAALPAAASALLPGDVAPHGEPDGCVSNADVILARQFFIGKEEPTEEEIAARIAEIRARG